MKSFRGAVHIHSSYSFDAQMPLEMIVSQARKARLQFICVTEHTHELDENRFASFLGDCRRFSSPELLIIPGLEITCEEGAHLLAIGLEHWIKLRKLEEILALSFPRKRESSPGADLIGSRPLFVLAHPSGRILSLVMNSKQIKKSLHGIEVWNRKYNGLLSPNPKAIGTLRKARQTNPALHAYGGTDFHDDGDQLAPWIVVQCEQLSSQSILAGLSAGNFHLQRGSISLSADGSMSLITRWRLLGRWAVRRLLFGALKWLKWNLVNKVGAKQSLRLEKMIRGWF